MLLNEFESKEMLRKAGITVIDTRLVSSQKAAIDTAKQIGFPVVMKIVSPDISHKSDVGGVRLGLTNAAQVGKAYREIINSVKAKVPNAKITGVTVQAMAGAGVEVIIGMSKDAQFGPVMMFGLGGILVEVLKDVSFRLIPLERKDAAEMIREIKGYALLQGVRGQPPADIAALEKLMVKVSVFIDKNPQIKELDLNPVIATKDGVIAVDARIVLE
ncbi:MAG: acetate--CoA ligase family protein [Dehalococcoidales bacterium]|nr:acetate--CoA ligase family protein [Dehalococcoidales bacterium]